MKTSKIAFSTWHDASAAVIVDGELDLLIHQERLTHKKHDHFSEVLLKQLDDLKIHQETTGVCTLDENSDHHLYHAAHSFYDSGYKEAVCVVVDGMGSEVKINHPSFEKNSVGRESVSIYKASYPDKFELVHRIVSVPFEANLCFDNQKSFAKNQISPALMFQKTCENWNMNWYDAGKLMAMSSYADEKYFEERQKLYDWSGIDFWEPFNEKFFEIDRNDARKVKISKQFETFQEKANFCKWLQDYCQEYVKQTIIKAVELSKCKNVCLSGGYFLNCVSNSYVRKNLPKDIQIFIEPMCGDDGVAIGLANLMYRSETKSKKIQPLQTIYKGIKREIDVSGDSVEPKDVAELIANGKVVSIFQSRSECGPRALGNRSILYDPRDANGREKINTLKGRENYRPLAATVLYEHAKKWFDMSFLSESPYMLYTLDVLSDKIPAVCHVDNTCRVQTLKKNFNPYYYNLIFEFYKLTEIPLVLNTSFNLAGDTIVETTEDAIRTLNSSDIDYLYFPEKGILVS